MKEALNFKTKGGYWECLEIKHDLYFLYPLLFIAYRSFLIYHHLNSIYPTFLSSAGIYGYS